jgi:hypothetical protein
MTSAHCRSGPKSSSNPADGGMFQLCSLTAKVPNWELDCQKLRIRHDHGRLGLRNVAAHGDTVGR